MHAVSAACSLPISRVSLRPCSTFLTVFIVLELLHHTLACSSNALFVNLLTASKYCLFWTLKEGRHCSNAPVFHQGVMFCVAELKVPSLSYILILG